MAGAGGGSRMGWLASLRHRRAVRALERQLANQEAKARRIQGHDDEIMRRLEARSAAAREKLERVGAIAADARVLEVGSGAHGLVFFFGTSRGVGIDPLAAHYRSLFPAWQGRVPTFAAAGEALPFADGAFDVVLCDNVIDHAEVPERVVEELARVLAPGGLLYFTVNVHHPFYGAVSRLHGAWTALGVPVEIRPFADHTVHLTAAEARRMFDPLPLRIAAQSVRRGGAGRARHAGDLFKRAFFKNAVFELVAVREPG
ncbi:class I SAM-dependent methyltransferase [Longimicrobium sp.]|uniref:class I SAM-dependent methyltransferase n=1 Tax=Longimicrobium sp. TaxID=2029185 RepID=UPI002E30B53E|nr:class I SAM-dependent methyltransferase [Longimicrobium sp.]HEX6042044.1 class I SAM-dependent methyltransferase [Longimicrobium sp.]